MKPTKRCACCNKPIWDHGYVTVRDSLMETDNHIHSQCHERERTERMEYERDLAMLREIMDSF